MDYKRIGGSLKEFKTEIPLIFLAVSRDAENWMREEWSCVCVCTWMCLRISKLI